MVKLRKAEVAEAQTLTALALRSKRAWGYDEFFMAAVLPDMIVHPEYLRDECGFVAEEDGGRVVGYAIVRVDGEEAFLRDLFIEPEHFRRGIGRALFAEAARYARSRGAMRLRLGGDPNAIGFYRRVGMTKIGEEPSIVGGGRMLPVMELQL